MTKNDIVLLDNPTIVGIQRKLEEHDDRFDEIGEKLEEHDQRFSNIEADIQEVKIVVRRIQEALLPQLDKLAEL